MAAMLARLTFRLTTGAVKLEFYCGVQLADPGGEPTAVIRGSFFWC